MATQKQDIQEIEDGSTGGGYDCELADIPPENIETECPVCHGIFREPQQLTCCGKVYCETCIKKALEENNSCPSCRAPRPDLWPDKRLKQSLSGCRVYCCHRGKLAPLVEGCRRRWKGRLEGCQWMGELGELDKHLNLKPSPGNQLYGCEYANIECKFCSERFQRKEIDSHQLMKCPKRTFNCIHCGYIDTYEVVTKTHFSLCPKFPMPCSKCKNKYERQNFENHVNKECPLTAVPCDFRVVGCTEEPARENMDSHLRKDLVSHASMLQNHLSQHPNDASKYLPLVARCLGQLVTENQDSHREQQRLSDSLRGTQQEFHAVILNLRRESQQNLRGTEQTFQYKVDELHKTVKEHTKQIKSAQESHQKFKMMVVAVIVLFVLIAVGLVV